jgi:hypothetical protein
MNPKTEMGGPLSKVTAPSLPLVENATVEFSGFSCGNNTALSGTLDCLTQSQERRFDDQARDPIARLNAKIKFWGNAH